VDTDVGALLVLAVEGEGGSVGGGGDGGGGGDAGIILVVVWRGWLDD
jgi:hypothetical protein